MEENLIKVYAQVDSNNVITRIESTISEIDFANGWIQIDEGTGEKYAHAQNAYLGNSLMDEKFRYNYKLVDGKPVELTEEEKEKLFPAKAPEPSKEELLQNQLLETQALVANLQEQILLQNGGK